MTTRRKRARRRAWAASVAGALIAAGTTWAVQLPAGAAPAAAGCGVDYTVSSVWQGGFGADVKITNFGDALSSWSLKWTFAPGQTVTQAWNADVTLNSSQVTAANVSYNGSIPSGGSASFGFNGAFSGSGTPTAPSSFSLNGVTCTGGTATTPPTTT
ncbi:cellulose binding domain-containing protein, partial [Streptomyces sp. IBSBF 2435]